MYHSRDSGNSVVI